MRVLAVFAFVAVVMCCCSPVEPVLDEGTRTVVDSCGSDGGGIVIRVDTAWDGIIEV